MITSCILQYVQLRRYPSGKCFFIRTYNLQTGPYTILKNSLIIHEENKKKITTVSVVLYVIKFHVNYINFSLDFENYFAIELTKMGRFLSDKTLLRVL